MSLTNKCDNPSLNNFKSTPPPTNRKVRNPFDKALIDRLHKPICSPGMCKIYKKKSTSTFRWDIDQACALVPADIVACNSQFEPSPDPALERIAEEATEQFFSQEMVMPSPLETSKKVKPSMQTSCNTSTQLTSYVQEDTTTFITREVQTILTLPPELPPELEELLKPFCTYTQDQNISGEYELTANGSLRRKLFFEEHRDMEHYDSEHTDEEIQVEPRPASSFEAHVRVAFSPDLSRDMVDVGMTRTSGTPLKKGSTVTKPRYRNKILDVVDLGEGCPLSPIEFRTPRSIDGDSATLSSLASASISPVTKGASSDEEKNNFTSPESEIMATCIYCQSDDEKKGVCFCKMTPNKIVLTRSMSLRDSPPRSRKGSISEKRSLSMSSLHRSRSVQKLDFSMDMSVDGSFHDNSQAESEYVTPDTGVTWSIVDESNIHEFVTLESREFQTREIQSQKTSNMNILDDTPIKGNTKGNVRSHEISKIRVTMPHSPLEMSLDSSLDSENPLGLEDKKIDFNTIDLKLLTENVSQFDYTKDATKPGDDVSSSFKRLDSGFNENTFSYASSYYESAIKPSELTVTNVTKNSKNVLKEISNVDWMRVDSGFKDETSINSMHFCSSGDTQTKKSNYYSELKPDKENTEVFDRFLVHSSHNNEAMSMSDIFNEDMTFNCNFSSTPSKNKSRKVNS